MWAVADLVGIPIGGYLDKNKDAGRTGFLLPEACGQGGEAIHMP